MWLFTAIGFFSVVRKPGDGELTVRTRVRADLDALRERYLPALGPTQAGGGTDYEYRARVSAAEFGAALGRMALDIDYSNFKSVTARRQGHERAHVYGAVHSALLGLQRTEE